MAKKGPRSYSNTFWMILGTSKNSRILGPIIDHFWARGPRIYGFSYTKIPQKILESLWEHLGKNIIFTFWNFKNFSNLDPLNTYLFWKLFGGPPPPKKIGIYYRFWRTLTMIRFGKSSETHYFDKMQNHKQILMNQTYFSKSDLSCVQEFESAYIFGIYGP